MTAEAARHLGVTGHQVLPKEAADLLRSRLTELTAARPLPILVSSLAVGADSIVAERMLEAGGRLHAVIPCEGYKNTFVGADARRHYESLVSRAENIEQLPYTEPSERAFLAAGYRVVEVCDWLWAVWDGGPARGLGGTADIVERARQLGRPVDIVWPAGLAR